MQRFRPAAVVIWLALTAMVAGAVEAPQAVGFAAAMAGAREALGRADYATAERLLRAGLEVAGSGAPAAARRLEALEAMGDLLFWQVHRPLDALPFYETANEMRLLAGSTHDARAQKTRQALSSIYASTAQWAKAAEIERQEIRELELKDGTSEGLTGRLTRLSYLLALGNADNPESKALLRRAAEVARTPEEKEDAYSSAGRYDLDQQRFEAAAVAFERAIEALAEVQERQGQFAQALTTLHRALAISRASTGAASAGLLAALDRVSRAAKKPGEQAQDSRASVADTVCTCDGELTPELEALRDSGQIDKARALAEASVIKREEAYGADSLEVADALGQLSSILWSTDPGAGAIAAARQTEILRSRRGLADPSVARAAERAAYLFACKQESARAETYYSLRVDSLRAGGQMTMDLAEALDELGGALEGRGQHAEAIEDFRLAAEVWTRVAGPKAPQARQDQIWIAWAFIHAQRYDDAEPILREELARLDLLRADTQEVELALDRALYALKEVCEATGRDEEAAALEARRMSLALYH